MPGQRELLCEDCGYDIVGLGASARCPECGRPVESSWPEARAGSAWQRKRGLRAWAVTNYQMLLRPGRTLDVMRVDERGMRSFLLVNILVASALLAAVWAGVLIGDPARHARGAAGVARTLILLRSVAIGTLAVSVILFLLTLIEAMGIRFFGARRGWRITRPIAWQICGHASVGWILSAVLTLLSMIVWLNLSYFGLAGWLERAGPGSFVLASVPALGFFAGMFVFELLVYVGMRRCRFANAPRESPRESEAPPSAG